MRRQLRYAFVEVLDPDRFTMLVESRVLPVLAPSGPEAAQRRAHYATVMQWYGAKEVLPASVRLHRPRTIAAKGFAHPVLVLDAETHGIATIYARVTGRPCHLVEGAAGAREALREASGSVLLAGTPASFSTSAIVAINGWWDGPWGVLTGRDLSGITFQVAKWLALHLRARRRTRSALVDEVGDCVRTLPRGVRSPLTPAGVNAILDSDWGRLVLHVHGEGSHANLRSMVLCGLLGEREHDLYGRDVPGGCARGKDAWYCKRRRGPHVRVAGIRDLRAEEVAFFSCNGFSVAGALYPSDVSCALAFADGFVAHALANDRPTPVDGDVLEVATRLLAAGADLGGLQVFENDRCKRKGGCRPYVLLGDPRASNLPVARWSPRMPLPTDGALALVQQPAAWPLLALDPPDPEAQCIRTSRTLAVWWRRAPRAGVRVVDASTRGRRAQAWLADALVRAAALPRLEAAVEQSALELDADGIRQIAGWLRLRPQMERVLAATAADVARAFQAGWWSPRVEQRTFLAATTLEAWDCAFARLVREILLQRDVLMVLEAGAVAMPRDDRAPCLRCGAGMMLGKGIVGDRVLETVQCPTCGPSSVSWTRGPRIHVVAPPELRAGGEAALRVRIQLEDRPRPIGAAGYLAAQLRDKGAGRVINSAVARVPISGRRVAWRARWALPSNLTPDLHTLSVVWTEGLMATGRRVRLPGRRA